MPARDGAAARAPGGVGTRGGDEDDEEALDDDHAAVVRPAQEVPVADLADGGHYAGGDHQPERARGERHEDLRPAAEDHEPDQPAEPQPGGEDVEHLAGDAQRADAGQRMTGDRVGEQCGAPRRAEEEVAPAHEQRDGEERDDEGAGEVDASAGAGRQQARVELAAARRRRAEEGLARGEQDERPRQREERAQPVGLCFALTAAQRAEQHGAAEENGRADDPEPARDDADDGLGRRAVVASRGAAAGEALGAGRRGAVAAGDAEVVVAADQVAVRTEDAPAHVVDDSLAQPRLHRRAVAGHGQGTRRDGPAAWAGDLDPRAARDDRFAEGDRDGRRGLGRHQPRRRRRL